MNQHASRLVAQGFPLHRRMNESIQSSSSGPSRTTPLRPSNPSVMASSGGPLRRSLGFKSQIPIRIGFEAQSSPEQTSLQARVLERHRQALLSTSQTSAAVTLKSIQAPSSSSSASQQRIDTAFKVYEDRLQTDLRDFRAMCSRLILQEQEEKEKWHTLCLKMMKERDTARQRVSALLNERETHLSSTVPASSAKENVPSKVSKRARDDETSSAAQELENTRELPSRSSPVESSRPIRSLRLSPIPSPPGSPSASLYNSAIAINSSSTSSESPPPPSSEASAPPTSSTPPTLCSDSSPVTPPLNIITFNPARSPNDKTCFDVFGEFDIPETRPVKRRKSYDSTSLSSDKKTVRTTEDGESGDHSRNEKDDAPRPFLIAHTDIMYMPMKGRIFCRACLLDKTINPSSSSNRTPKTFPTTVCWDELRDHCVGEHPTACADVARLCPADLHELRRRLYNL